MLQSTSANFHVEYMDVVQHWHPDSERYAGGDCLLTYLANDWELGSVVKVETKWFAGMRFINVYHFTLKRDGETMVMPVINNPFVDKFVSQPALQLHSVQEAE